MPCYHWVPLIDLHSGEPFPMVPVGDFQLVDKIFPGTPRDSLLFNSDDLTKLQKMRFQTPHLGRNSCLQPNPRRRSLNPPMPQGRCPAQPARRENLPSPEESLPGLHHQKRPQTHPAESLCTMANAPLHARSAMICVKKIHTAPHPSTRTNPAGTGAARTKRVARPHRNLWCLHHRGCLLLNGQRRSLA